MHFKNNYYYLWKKIVFSKQVIEHIFRLDCNNWKENALR